MKTNFPNHASLDPAEIPPALLRFEVPPLGIEPGSRPPPVPREIIENLRTEYAERALLWEREANQRRGHLEQVQTNAVNGMTVTASSEGKSEIQARLRDARHRRADLLTSLRRVEASNRNTKRSRVAPTKVAIARMDMEIASLSDRQPLIRYTSEHPVHPSVRISRMEMLEAELHSAASYALWYRELEIRFSGFLGSSLRIKSAPDSIDGELNRLWCGIESEQRIPSWLKQDCATKLASCCPAAAWSLALDARNAVKTLENQARAGNGIAIREVLHLAVTLTEAVNEAATSQTDRVARHAAQMDRWPVLKRVRDFVSQPDKQFRASVKLGDDWPWVEYPGVSNQISDEIGRLALSVLTHLWRFRCEAEALRTVEGVALELGPLEKQIALLPRRIGDEGDSVKWQAAAEAFTNAQVNDWVRDNPRLIANAPHSRRRTHTLKVCWFRQRFRGRVRGILRASSEKQE